MTTNARVLRFDHVNVTTPEELEADVIGWYENCLGLERIAKPDGTHDAGAWFQIGEAQIHISRDEHNPHKAAHFCLQVEDFQAVVERLREASCHIEQAGVIPGRHRLFTRDPAGNRIELMSFDGPSTNDGSD